MKILGIETATAVCAAAIVDGESTVVERSIEAQHVHAEKLLTLIDECFSFSGLSIASLDGIAVSMGPGSFTGLRIGLSTAKGLCYSHNVPLVGVPTLEALAWHAVWNMAVPVGSVIVPLIDARRDEVYTAFYRHDRGQIVELMPPHSCPISTLPAVLGMGKPVIVIGDGAEKFERFLSTIPGTLSVDAYVFPSREAGLCSANTVARLGEQMLHRGVVSDLTALEPLYVKDFYTLVQTQHSQEKA